MHNEKCLNCGEQFQSVSKYKFCSKKCYNSYRSKKQTFDKNKNNYGDGYDPYLALFAAILLPDSRRFNHACCNPKALSNVGHTLLEYIINSMEKHSNVIFFAKTYGRILL